MIIHPDVELWLCQYLRAGTTGVSVGITLPDQRPAKSIIVSDHGGRRLDVLRKRFQVGVNIRADDPEGCSELSRLVSALVWEAADLDEIVTRVREPISGQVVPEPSPQTRRYSSFEIDLRGANS